MSTLDQLRGIMSRITRCNEEEINLDTLLKDVNADSLHWVQIVVGVETAFDIEVDFDKMREMTTIGEFVSYIDNIK